MSDDEEGMDSSNFAGAAVLAANLRQQQNHQQFSLPPVPPNQGPPSISLTYLIDFAVQRTFQDLTVLAELLPKKSDMERKISMVQFAHSTRQLFIRLLAAVRWAKSASKVDLCMGISYFLDQQATIFVETADRLFQLSREVLPQARLPAFQIPAAVDVLVLGSYPRLPTCIKTRFVPDDAITVKEQTCVLRRLNQVIQQRLIFAPVPLPDQMQNFTIRNGTVTFVVPSEFEASLTLLGEESNVPWSLLNIKILVEDYETGEGSDLVHPLQLNYIHELVEARMLSAEEPIAELYNVLHTFCVYLQLDILFCQASKYVHDRMIESVSVDEYVQGYKMTLTYWKTATGAAARRLQQQQQIMSSSHGNQHQQNQNQAYAGFNYKIMIHVDLSGTKKALRVVHIPSADVRLPSLDDYRTAGGDIALNLENLLCDTVLTRIRHRLTQLKQRLDGSLARSLRVAGKVPTLEIFLLDPLIETEKLNVSINLFTGHFVCSVDSLDKTRILEEIERLLNLAQWQKVADKLYDFKIALLMERCRKTAVGLPVQLTDTVPLLPNSTALRSLSPHRLFFRFSRHDAFYLVVEFASESEFVCKIRYYLLSTCSANALISALPSSSSSTEKGRDMSGVCEFVKPVTMLLLDVSAFISLPPANKVPKKESYILNELATVITKCDQRMPFIVLCEEFERKGIKTQTLREEEGVGCIILNVLGFTKAPSTEDKRLIDALWSNTVVRLLGRLMHDRNRLHWTFELVTSNIPLVGIHQRHGYVRSNDDDDDEDNDNQQVRMTVLNTAVSADGAGKCADDLLNAMCAFGRLYDLIVRFAPTFKKWLKGACEVVSLSINRLVLAYGPRRQFFVMLQWKQQQQQQQDGGGGNFHLSFGTHVCSPSSIVDQRPPNFVISSENPHSIMVPLIGPMFNRRRSLAYLMQYLNDTIDPLLSLQSLSQCPTTGVGESVSQSGGYGHVFTVLPISPTVMHVMYRLHLAFEVNMVANGEVILRDCGAQIAGSQQQQAMKASFRFAPIVGFKSFFVMHEQLSGTSDRNRPPSCTTTTTGSSPSRQPIKQESFEKGAGSPLKMRPESVKQESPAPSSSYPMPSPAAGGATTGVAAPSPLSASTPSMSQSQQQHVASAYGAGSTATVTPTPSPATAATNFAGLLTPSPAPASNAGLLMTPSPAPFPLQSPAPAAAAPHSVSSVCSATAANSNNAPPPLSPAGPEPSPLSFMKSFASEASAAGAETKGGGDDFGNWGEFSTVASMTPVTTAAPFPLDNLPIGDSSQASAPPSSLTTASSSTVAVAATTAPGATAAETLNTDEWEPSPDPVIVSHDALRSACQRRPDGRTPLKEYLGSISALDKLPRQPNSIPVITVTGPGQTSTKVGSLDMKIHLDQTDMTRLVLKITGDGRDAIS